MTAELNYIAVLTLGVFSGIALTLMDRIDEHRIIESYRTPFAYLAGITAVASVILTIQLYPVLYSLPFFICIEWIIKNKIDFPSHVFSLFLLALYFGWRIDLLYLNAAYIIVFLLIRYISGTLLRQRLYAKSVFFQWYYDSYMEKYVGNIIFAVVLWSPLVLIYSLGVGMACFYTKRLLPGKLNCIENETRKLRLSRMVKVIFKKGRVSDENYTLK